MTQTLEEGMKNQSKCIKIPMEIRPFDVGYRIVNKHGQALALKKRSKYIRFTFSG
ncbi:TPA: hypothetical protein VVR03_001461 [Streptococcus pneumoniae]|nr:hypothetical protein [Streptococcus pneumoniae]